MLFFPRSANGPFRGQPATFNRNDWSRNYTQRSSPIGVQTSFEELPRLFEQPAIDTSRLRQFVGKLTSRKIVRISTVYIFHRLNTSSFHFIVLKYFFHFLFSAFESILWKFNGNVDRTALVCLRVKHSLL